MDLGCLLEVCFFGIVVYLGYESIVKEDLQYVIDWVGLFSSDNWVGIERILYCISVICNCINEIIGLICWVGWVVFGIINFI